MAGKPYVITNTPAAEISQHRDDQGRFTRPPNLTVERMQELAKTEGRDLTDVVAEQRVPDRPVVDGNRADADALPKTQQWNDAARKPFKV